MATRACGVLFAVLLTVAATAAAQTTTATIEGTVRDASGAVIQGAEVTASGDLLGAERRTTSDARGVYRLTALPAGTYTIVVTASGLATTAATIEVTLNRLVTFDVTMQVGGVQETISVSTPALDVSTSATATTITPRQITDFPVNGRNYLDLMQLVPGVAINRQVSPSSDNANPVLGERSGNNNFFIDGQPNKDSVNGGAAAQFNQETIAEFQVLTTSYKAEFGQATGAIVNVITKSGANDYHGVGSFFHRNNAFDASNSLDPARTEAPFLLRWDYSIALGGRIIKDKVFFFGSSERITETRRLDFVFPPATPQIIRDFEAGFNNPTRSFETRNFLKFDEQLSRHHLVQQMNYTNSVIRYFLPLSEASNLPR